MKNTMGVIKVKKILFILPLLAVLLASSAFAVADVTIYFNRPNVDIRMYTCLDAACNQVSTSPFSYSGHTDNGQVTVSFPSCPSTYGYAVYFVSPGYVPMEGIATYHTYCDTQHYSASANINFYQIANCASTIDEFTITNTAYANEPLAINTDALLDAATHSAFYDPLNNVGYVPPEFKDVYYSADIKVDLEVRNSASQLVSDQDAFFDAAHGNPIYMSEVKHAQFMWTPLVDGTYTATVRTTVTDNQCSSNIPLSASQAFTVLPERPTNECYTILNTLAVSNPNPMAGQQLTFTYTKISNYADAAHNLYAIPTIITYTIKNSANQVVYTGTVYPGANPNIFDPVQYSFQWTPTTSDTYSIQVSGLGNSASCNGLSNPVDVDTLNIYVTPVPTYDVTFVMSDDASGAFISGATVTSAGKTGTTNSYGSVTLTSYANGHYTYTVTHPLYTAISGEFDVTSTPKTISRTMHRINTPPVLVGIPDITIPEDATDSSLDLDTYAQDDQDLDSQLTFASTQPANIAVSINSATHVVTFTPTAGFTGSRTVTFTVTDTQGLTASDSMIATVDAVNDAPVISNLPDQTLNEDSSKNDAFNLNDYASDADNSDSQLVYSLTSVTNSNGCGITIDAQDNIDINPNANFNGICDATVRVTDPGNLYDEDTFRVTVNAQNDPPSQINVIPAQTWIQGTSLNNAFDLDNYFRDVEGSTLTYTASTTDNPNINVVIGAGNVVSFNQPASFYGVENVVFTANDGNGGILNSNTVSLTVTQSIFPQNVEISCFNDVVANHEQVCSVHVTSNGVNLGGSTVTIRYADSSVFGTCTTDAISGGCSATRIETVPGDYTVSATATHAGYTDGTSAPFTYTVYSERYDIQTLRVYRDSGFQFEDYDFLRGENMYVQFSAVDMFTGMPVDNLVSRATLVSPQAGGMTDLTQMAPSINGVYRFQLVPIPPSHDFIGQSQVFTFVFNFTDASGGEEFVELTIRNNPPVIVGTIPDQNVQAGQTMTFDLTNFESDIEDHGTNLAWSVSGVNNALLNANINGKILSMTGVAQGTDAITLTLTDLDGDVDTQNLNVVVSQVPGLTVILDCFDEIVQNHEQVCGVHVTSNGVNVGGSAITIRYADNSIFGTCTTDAISGGCSVTKIETLEGDYTVIATATHAGYTDGTSAPYPYHVYAERYDIQNLRIYNDAGFQTEDYDFLRGQNMYVQFSAIDMLTGMPVDNLVSSAALVSPQAGGNADLTQIGTSINGVYRFQLTPIPPTHDFIGTSQVFTFVFNYVDQSGGEEFVTLTIRNNLPVIVGTIPDQNVQVGQTRTFDLTNFESDIEDHGTNLAWSVSGVNNALLNANINGKILSMTGVAQGTDAITLTLTDLDGDVDTQNLNVVVSNIVIPGLEVGMNCFPNVVENHEQVCGVHVTSNGTNVGGSTVTIRYADNSIFGTCTTDAISGGCSVTRLETVPGDYTVSATATHAGYLDGTSMPFTYTVYAERYDIQNLRVYNDPAFQNIDYDFFRGEDMYVRFEVIDMTTGLPADDLVSSANLVSPQAGGNADLTQIGTSINGVYRFQLTPIPPTHDFIGTSQVYTFVFNFVDQSGGEEQVSLTIRNNLPVIVGTIPDQNVQVGQTVTFDLTNFESDIEDHGANLAWSVSGINNAFLNANINGKVLTLTGVAQGTDAITLTLTDLDGDVDTQNINVVVSDIVIPGLQVGLNCFPDVVANHEQVCGVHVTSNGSNIGGSTVTIRYADNSIFGTCTTDAISGGCSVTRLETVPGDYTVSATATHAGYLDGTSMPFTYTVYAERYDIQNLRVYNDPAFQNIDYDFFRGEDMYVRFEVIDMTTGLPGDDLVSSATLVSPQAGGSADLVQIGTSVNGVYRFQLTPIPPTHDFIGTSQVYSFVFNFVDQSGGEEQVSLTIRNNLPVIVGTIPDQNVQVGQTVTFDLSPFESDIEDHGNNLTWSVSGVDNALLNANVNGKVLSMTGVAQGTDAITLTLTDLDGDVDTQNINVVVSTIIIPGLQVGINCFPDVVANHEQVCGVHVTSNGTNVAGSTVTIRYADNSIFGTCTTDAISGGCSVTRLETVPGDYTVSATATHAGYLDGTSMPFTYTVYAERYDIQNLRIYNDPAFQNIDYDFFRGEDMYVRFEVIDTITGLPADNLVSSANLVSPQAGGSADLTQIGTSVNGVYRFQLTPIPATHDFIGQSQLYTFVFNFVDQTGGEEQVTLTIRNNLPVIVGTIPDQTVQVGQTITVDLTQYESDIEDSGNDLTWSLSGVNNALLDANVNGKILSMTGVAQGTDAITLTLTDLDGDVDTQSINVVVNPIPSIDVELTCFPSVVENHEQVCSVHTTSNGVAIGGSTVTIRYDDGSLFGICSTDAISGGCNVQRIETVPGDYTVSATATHAGYTDGTSALFTYTVYTERYDIQNLRVYNDAGFQNIDYDFFRGEDMYVRFTAVDMFSGLPVDDLVSSATLVSPPGGSADLTQIGTSVNGVYSFRLTPIPPTHDFLGTSQVFTFVFNFVDQSGGEEQVSLTIRNNLPVIVGTIPDQTLDIGQDISVDLSSYEYDLEDSGNNLVWSVSGVNTALLDAQVNGKTLLLHGVADGTNVITLTLTDLDGDSDSQNVVVNIMYVGYAPQIISTPITTAIEEQAYTYDVDAIDANGDAITYSLVNAPVGMTIDANTGLIQWTPTTADLGDHDVTVRASDGVLYDEQNYVLTVLFNNNINHAPYFTSTPVTTANDNELYTYDSDAADPDGDSLEYSLVSAPAGMTINPSNGLIQWTPTQSQIGSHNVIVRVSDESLDAIQSYTIDVGDVTHAPIITSIPVTTAIEGDSYTYDVDAVDPDGDAITYSLVSAPAGMTIDANTGLIQWTPTTADLGDHDVTVMASDGALYDLQDYVLTVEFNNNINHAPYITSTPVITASDNELYTYNVDAVDPDGDAITYSLVSAPAGMTINEHNGLIEWTPTQAQAGNHNIVVRASDGALSGDQSFTISVNDVPHAPVITSTPITVLNIEDPRNFDETYTYDVNAYDPDGDAITYSLITAPAGMTIDANTGLITWEPTENQVGLNHVIVQVSDGALTARQEFTVNVIVPEEVSSPKRKIIIDSIGIANGGMDHVEAGSVVRAAITLTNGDYYRADDLIVSFTIPELGVKRTIGPFDLPAKSSATKSVTLEIPEGTDPGIYEIRVSAANSKYQRTRFVEMTVV